MTQKDKEDFSLNDVLIKLLQGFLYNTDHRYWDRLLSHQDYVRNYFKHLNLSLHLNPQEGYAYLGETPCDQDHQNSEKEDSNESRSHLSLVRRIPLNFEMTLLAVLLRENLEHFDARGGDDHRAILKRSEIYDALGIYLDESHDQLKQQKKFDGYIAKMVELGFLRALTTDIDRFEIKRTIKALVNFNFIHQFKENLKKIVPDESSKKES